MMTVQEQYSSRLGLSQFCRNINHFSSCVIGALANGRLEAVSAIFFKELCSRINSESPSVRQEILSLCNAMKSIQLHVDSEDSLAATLNIVSNANPLLYTPPFKKSQVSILLFKF